VCETVGLSVGGREVRLFAKGQSFDESKKHELSAAANRWTFVTPARMFLHSALSLNRILPAVMLNSGI
jgi:hypothetical protein